MHKGNKKLKYGWREYQNDTELIALRVKLEGWKIENVYGPPRGGCIPAVMLSHKLKCNYLTTLDEKHNPENTLIVDDVSDSGKTLSKIKNIKKYKTATLFIKTGTMFYPQIYCRRVERNVWIVYPWEME